MKRIEYNNIKRNISKKDLILQKTGNLIFYVFLLIGFMLFSYSTQYIDVKVSGASMQPTINSEWTSLQNYKEDTVFIDLIERCDRGDIIVIDKNDRYIIKRLIGIENDRINIIRNELTNDVELFVNGTLIVEDYVVYKNGLETTLTNFETLKDEESGMSELFNEDGELVVPKGQIFYLGDNRGFSMDSSIEGPTSKDNLVGKVEIIIPYGLTFTNVLFRTLWGFIPEPIQPIVFSILNWIIENFKIIVSVIAILILTRLFIKILISHYKKKKRI